MSGKKFQYKLKAYKERQQAKEGGEAKSKQTKGKEDIAEGDEEDLSMEEMDAMFGEGSDDKEAVEEEEEGVVVDDEEEEEEDEEGETRFCRWSVDRIL